LLYSLGKTIQQGRQGFALASEKVLETMAKRKFKRLCPESKRDHPSQRQSFYPCTRLITACNSI